jgi:hypothetical protein
LRRCLHRKTHRRGIAALDLRSITHAKSFYVVVVAGKDIATTSGIKGIAADKFLLQRIAKGTLQFRVVEDHKVDELSHSCCFRTGHEFLRSVVRGRQNEFGQHLDRLLLCRREKLRMINRLHNFALARCEGKAPACETRKRACCRRQC